MHSVTVAAKASNNFGNIHIEGGLASNMISFVGEPGTTALVSKQWHQLTKSSFIFILDSYANEGASRIIVQIPKDPSLWTPTIKKIFQFVMSQKDVPLIRPMIEAAPLAPSTVALAQDTNLVDFFEGVLRGIPEDQRPDLTGLNTTTKAATIRVWMEENKEMLSGIQQLNLRGCNLKALPPEFSLFTGLQNLDLRWNQLNALPEDIGRLSNLRELYLGNNRLDELPDSITRLENLRVLDLFNNQMTTMSLAFMRFAKTLERAHLKKNPFPDWMKLQIKGLEA